jgi:hypothetical protein
MNENLIDLLCEAAGTILMLCRAADQPHPAAETLARELSAEASRIKCMNLLGVKA